MEDTPSKHGSYCCYTGCLDLELELELMLSSA
jgi:hypothetical protein